MFEMLLTNFFDDDDDGDSDVSPPRSRPLTINCECSSANILSLSSSNIRTLSKASVEILAAWKHRALRIIIEEMSSDLIRSTPSIEDGPRVVGPIHTVEPRPEAMRPSRLEIDRGAICDSGTTCIRPRDVTASARWG